MMEPSFVEKSVGGWELDRAWTGSTKYSVPLNGFKEDDYFWSYKLTNEWFLAVHPNSIRAYPLHDLIRTKQGLERPQKVFDIDHMGGISGGGRVSLISIDNEDKPWRKPTTLAGLQLCYSGERGTDNYEHPYVMRCTLWDFETCSILQHIPIKDPLETEVKFCCFVDDLFFIIKSGEDPSEFFLRDPRSAKPDWGRQGAKVLTVVEMEAYSDEECEENCGCWGSCAIPPEEIIHVTEKDNIVLIVTQHKIIHFQRKSDRGLEFLKTETMYKRDRFMKEGADHVDRFSFFEHLALDYSLTVPLHYTLRDISKSRYDDFSGQIIWTGSDPENTINLQLDITNSLQMWGMTVNFNASTESRVIPLHMNKKRVFVTMSLQDVVASPNFVDTVRSLIEKTPARDDPAIPPATIVGAPTLLPRRIFGTSSCMAIAKFQLDPAAYAVNKQLTGYDEIVTFIVMNA